MGGEGIFLGVLDMLIFFFGGFIFFGWVCIFSLVCVEVVLVILVVEYWNYVLFDI